LLLLIIPIETVMKKIKVLCVDVHITLEDGYKYVEQELVFPELIESHTMPICLMCWSPNEGHGSCSLDWVREQRTTDSETAQKLLDKYLNLYSNEEDEAYEYVLQKYVKTQTVVGAYYAEQKRRANL